MDARLDLALKQIEFAREYVETLLADIQADEWFRMPAGASTHLGWQLGHLAMAQYGLALFRQRGRQPEDLQLMTSSFRKQFSRGTVPEPDPAKNPPIAEIRDTFDRVYQQALLELPQIAAATLDEPIDMPYAAYPTKYGALLFCSCHEMLHAGQIGVLRRLLGRAPVR
ncbi:DinB superfamily protein [Anatilimnocola aggregata]|uniref:DinB superfamily protein n=1 Tax=Anatilimnocola aggregata TaxID=2528021 RepID=A0A517YHJ3_9BACT|nr:DinB family protein [Anatilimnocola aggregata]QDU29696.1 DinB superfamily protein [Anatilimnocola aggregata]